MRKFAYGLAAGLFAATLSATTVQAATIYEETHDYGLGQYDPSGSDVLVSDGVVVSDTSLDRFSDSFDFTAVDYDSIDSISLTLTFSDAGPAGLGFLEAWTARIQGSDPGSSSDDFFALLFDPLSPQSITISLSTDVLGVDAFAHTLDTGVFEFWFSEFSTNADAFTLDSATLSISGTLAAVPLPATGALMLLALGGIAATRRKTAA
ncbi:VPLPA-CTERM sorting domain-containing protein [Flavimaricola marinus]|uniref:PEP-CTERM protein-sorting domain-containing protein n=1 Tax=Flavimaricola marinus TaxID=1819565 RepID=A0A238LI05_9RHOB|nr:VPLPA-CTERM sorting domain-containing protein [Flavimaricola marinus]SMY09281.1 hypothetical protein LOM8899_03446 [Flavimaricola marinus]